jgi:hypothetical protein
MPSTAFRVTVLPPGKLSLQSVPQLIPPGELVTVPLPVPVVETVSVAIPTGGSNVAVLV